MIGIRLAEELEDNIYKIFSIFYRYDSLPEDKKEGFIEIDNIPNKPENIPDDKIVFKVYNEKDNKIEWRLKDKVENSEVDKAENYEVEVLREEIDDLWLTVLESEGVL